MLKQYKLRNYNFRLVIYVITLTILGIMVIGSARESVQNKQILGLFLGSIAMICVSVMDYSFILKFSWLYYFFNIVLLLLVSVMDHKDRRRMGLQLPYQGKAERGQRRLLYFVRGGEF